MGSLLQEPLGGAAAEVGRGPFLQRKRTGGRQSLFHREERMVRGEQDPAPATARAHELDHRRIHVLGQVGQLSYPATAPGGMGTCGTSVSMRYKYPFPFRIPFTNLDLNTIQLPGQAEMRAETQ